MLSGPEGFKRTAARLRTACPDLQLSIEFMVAEADMVVARWTIRGTQKGPLGPISPTGKPVEFAGVNIFRIASGKIVEIWNHRDDLLLYQQLGVIPPQPQSPSQR
jgi:predicted ester cyclase